MPDEQRPVATSDTPPCSPQTYAAWPLGCVVAGLSLLVMVNAFGLFGIMAAAGGAPRWLELGAPLCFGLLPLLAQIVGWWFARRRNRYAARVLLWSVALTLAFGAIVTVVLNVIDILTLRR